MLGSHLQKEVVPARSRSKNAPVDQSEFNSSQKASGQTVFRKAPCACGGGCPSCQSKSSSNISQPNDPAEIEADRIADKVMRMPASETGGTLRKSIASADAAFGHIHRKPLSTKSPSKSHSPAHVQSAISSGGQPLDLQTRDFFEPRMGYDFSSVRIHTSDTAEQSAKAVDAKAYTLANNIVFGAGRYAPRTNEGQRLLAHELTHVVQQNGSSNKSIVQRAEVDDRSCTTLKDIQSDVDTFVNKVITDERNIMAKPIFGKLLSLHVMKRLGGGQVPFSPIEVFIETLPDTKRTIPPDSLAGTKYTGVENVNRFYKLQTMGAAHVVGSVAKIHGICVGTDKLGHFFDQGFQYLSADSAPGSKPSDIDNLGNEMEAGLFGLGATGVFSNADISANRAGMKFYKDLEKNPEKFMFGIRSYITNKWNEQVNPSFYETRVGGVVWSTLLTGQWQGTFTTKTNPSSFKTKFDLIATAAGSLTGTIDLQAQKDTTLPGNITIKAGKINQSTTNILQTSPIGTTVIASPVSGISIEFAWERGTMSGMGKLDSVNEQTLMGTMGIGSLTTGSGTLKLKKV